jgi:putative tryptophan/tyrosine transport system substrate-binding protein
MRRRDFIAGISAVPWPLAARAQQRTVPVIGFLALGSNGPKRWGASLYQGLKEAGYVEGQNVAIEYRGGPPNVNRLRDLAAELVQQQVTLILTHSDGAALGAKRATSTVPIVFFSVASDPVKLGLVASINGPGGNVTGATFDSPRVAAKRLDLLCQLIPTAARVAYLIRVPALSFDEERNSLVEAASVLGRELIIAECRSENELGHSFANMLERGAGAVTVGFLGDINLDAVVSFAAKCKLPAAYPADIAAFRGGLMSYGRDYADEIRIAASLVGEILNGAIPANLPVRTSAKFNFTINLKTAKELGLDIPRHLLLLANNVIE